MRVFASFAARLLLLCLVSLGTVTCGQKPLLAPFVDVMVTNVPGDATQLQVNATFDGKTKTELSSNTTLDHFTISLPNDARGSLALQATVRNAQNCIVAVGQLSEDVMENKLYQLTLMLTAQTPPLCPGSGLIPITVNKAGFGGGSIVATPAALSCDNSCTTKMAELDAGTVVTLNVDTSMLASGSGWNSTFDGWSGACSGTTTCFVTLAQATTVTARFSCHGWCPEKPPTENSNLNGIWAFSPQRIVAVGDGGKILQWDNTSWKPVNSTVTANLRSVHGISGGIGYAVGDTGTILKTTDSGTTWMQMTTGTVSNLRGVWANDATSIYAVGDTIATGKPWLNSNGTTWFQENLGTVDYPWNAVWGYATVDYFVVGESGRTVIRNPFNTPTALNTVQLNGIFGTSRDTMTVVGLGSTIWRLNNTTWTVMNKPAGTGFIVLRGIHGTPTNMMYTVGDAGTVWHTDTTGTMWEIESFPENVRLNSVHVLSASELYVVGAGGLIYHKKI